MKKHVKNGHQKQAREPLGIFKKALLVLVLYLIGLFSIFLAKDFIEELKRPPILIEDFATFTIEKTPKEDHPYTVVDSNINRKVSYQSQLLQPVKPRVIFGGSQLSKKVAITIDDGFNINERIIDLLEAYKIKCTVFLVGYWAENNPELVDRMDKLGWEVCSHTYSHRKPITKMSNEELIKDIVKGQRAITRITHKVYPYFRPPWGEYNKGILEELAKEGFYIILWTNGPGGYNEIDSKDWQVMRVMSTLKPGDILLFHFGTYHTYDVLKELIPKIMDEGYEFATISEMVRDLHAYTQ